MPPQAVSTDTELAPGTRLLCGQYRIDRALSKGGFGITYLAHDSLDRHVVIKECFPQDHCTRRGIDVSPSRAEFTQSFALIQERFKREAFRLAKLDHPRVVGVHQIFEENGTAYLSMDHIQGEDLFTIVEEDPKRLTRPVLKTLLTDALEALDYMHGKGLLHRDLAPDNFILSDDDHLTVIDFGSACEMVRPAGAENATLLSVKDGYSPHEFYDDSHQDAASDIYSLAATFHYLLTGYAPADSQDRLAAVQASRPDPFEPLKAQDADKTDYFVDLINQGLALAREERLPSARAWMEGLRRTAYSDIDAARISRLVSDTNDGLTPHDPSRASKSAQDAKEAARKAEEAAKPRQYVDIFGNPIEDVDAYLREQDKGRKKRKPKTGSRSKRKQEPRPKPPRQGVLRQTKSKGGPSVLTRMADGLGLNAARLTPAIPQS